MIAQDLMLGDWVRIIDPDKYAGAIGKIYSLASLEGAYFAVNIKDVNYGYLRTDVFSEDISPIPLTPEILEKNGFEDIGDDTWQLTDIPYRFWIDFLNHRYGCEFDTSSYENEDSENRLYLYGIPDVHELQHALRLCGIDKEITL